jgi:Zn-dependent protease
MLACPACRKLVHSERLAALARDAKAAESEGRISDALQAWRDALELLPSTTTQHAAILRSIRRLSEAVDGTSAAPPKRSASGTAAGLGAVGVVVVSWLGKAKLLASGLTSIPTLLSMFAWLALDRGRGPLFAIGLVASIYVHEMGHVYALRMYGIKATAPMFIPGLGALVRLKQYPIDAREDARVGLAGPIWGCAAAVVALVPGLVLRHPGLLAIASLGATINLFNLIPLWQLDGARGYRALDAKQRMVVVALAAASALVSGQPIGWLVAAVGGVRVKSDVPERGDAQAYASFIGLVVVLTLIAWWGATPALQSAAAGIS